jgi:uncharacterized protein involved in exopolysaccharide biosynthesis
MRQSEYSAARDGSPAHETALDNYLQIDLPRLMFWLRRGIWWIMAGALIGLLAGAVYAKTAKPRYTVTTDILMDPAGLQIVSDDLFRQNEQQRDSQLLNVESKRQTLLSRSVLLRALTALELQNDPEFVPPPSFLSRFSIGALLGGGETGVSQSSEIIALDSLMERVTARRDEVSFVITMWVWSRDAAKSIRISQAIVEAFKEELIEADSEGAGRTATALVSRIDGLKAEVNAAEQAVEEFRRNAGLRSSQGELVSSRSMSQINQQLVEARERLIAAESRYQELISGNAGDVAAMQSNTISALRTQYATLKYQADAEALVYGPRHPRLVKQQTELSVLQSEIAAETARLVQAAKNEFEQAKAVVEALGAEASTVSSGVFSDNDAQVRLRELTRDAASKTTIYEAFLARAGELTERQQLDTTNIRVISPPVMPRSRSWPPSTSQVAGFGAIVGMVTSMLAVLAYGISADTRRTPYRQDPPPPTFDRDRRRPALNEPVDRAKHVGASGPQGGSLLNMWSRDPRAATRQ